MSLVSVSSWFFVSSNKWKVCQSLHVNTGFSLVSFCSLATKPVPRLKVCTRCKFLIFFLSLSIKHCVTATNWHKARRPRSGSTKVRKSTNWPCHHSGGEFCKRRHVWILHCSEFPFRKRRWYLWAKQLLHLCFSSWSPGVLLILHSCKMPLA